MRTPGADHADHSNLMNDQIVQALVQNELLSVMILKAVRDKDNAIVDFEYVFINRKAEESVGLSDLTGKRFLEAFPGSIASGIFNKYVTVTETGVPWSEEFLVSQDGFNSWTTVKTTKFQDGCFVVYSDINQRKIQEIELVERNKLLQAVFEGSITGLAVFRAIRDTDKKIVDFEWILTNQKVNKEDKRVDLIGKRYSELFPGIVSSGVFQKYVETVETGKSLDFELHYTSEGYNDWYRIVTTKFGDGFIMSTEDITVRKSVESYKELVTNARNIILRMDNEGRFTYINDFGIDFFGFKEEELIGKTALETIVPDFESTGRNLDTLVQDIYKDPDKYSVNINENVKKNGERVWIEWYNKAVYESDGSKVGHIAIGFDITESKKIKEALQESEQRFRTIAETVPVLVSITRLKDNVVLFTNEYNNKAFGMKGKDIMGTKGPDYYSNPADREKMVAIFREKGHVDSYQLKVKKSDGTPFWILTSVRPITYEGHEAMIGASIDITDYKKAEENLLSIQKKLDIALENGKIGTWEWNFKEGIISLGERTGRMFGLNSDSLDMKYEEFEQLIHEEDVYLLRNSIKQSVESTENLYVILRTRSGDANYLSLRAMLNKDENGSRIGFTGVCFDITDMRKGVERTLMKLNEELLKSNNDLQQFAYVASHDLQEPLRMISSFTQLLQKRYHDRLDDDANEFINYAVDGSRRMYELLNGLLAFSRVNSRGSDFATVDMNSVFEKVIANLRLRLEETKAEIIAENLPVIFADESQMIQLMQNLIENGIKFSKSKPEITISGKSENDYEIISVADKGIGIEKVYFDRIFRIFQKLHAPGEYPGTGIGLSICKRIIDRHGGRIWVESSPGKGSAFYFSIPRNKAGSVS